MMEQYNRIRARRRLAIIALFGLAIFAAIALYNSAIAADQQMVLSLYHDANHDGQRQTSEVPAANYAHALALTDAGLLAGLEWYEFGGVEWDCICCNCGAVFRSTAANAEWCGCSDPQE